MGFFRDLTGKTAVQAAGKAADVQVEGAQEAIAMLDPFKAIGEQGLAQSNFLTDPQAQYDFLVNNPFYQNAMAAGDRNVDRLMQSAAARGRLSAGDTAEQLQMFGQQNLLNAAYPLIGDQKQTIGDLLNYGMTTASNQGNLRTGQAAAAAGGIVGAANARGARAGNLLSLGMDVAAMFAGMPPPSAIGGGGGGSMISQSAFNQQNAGIGFSDPKLKTGVSKIGESNGYNLYSWTWNDKANEIGLYGREVGVMADEVEEVMPSAVVMNGDYMTVNYDMIGVSR